MLTLFLQVYVPTTYTGPSDQIDLGTLYVAYIPSSQVDALEAMIKAKQSKFYTGLGVPAAQQLAATVMSGWQIVGEVGLGGDDGSTSTSTSSGGGSGNGSDALSGGSDAVRRDAIVGVVSSLGAIAVLVLVVLVVHSVKRKREMAHRRLTDRGSDSSGGSGGLQQEGVQEGGREFDRDSVGGQRRRSFYFAEDSLRGWEAERELNEFGEGTTTMTQRRTVILPGSISAPILRESSMNW